MSALARPVAVAGVGYAPISRVGAADINRLTLFACRAALDDAGLVPGDVDGIFEYQFGIRGDSPAAVAVQRMLGIPNLHVFNDLMGTGPSGLAGAMDATMAVASGMCETALVYRTINRAAGHTGALRTEPVPASGAAQFTAPYGLGGGIIHGMGMRKQRRIAELGGSAEDYGYVALNARAWAAGNERAVLRDPITMDDYLASRPVAEPLVLLDCDYPVNAACAVVVTTAERAADLAQPVVTVDALAYGTGADPDWLYAEDFLFGGTRACAARLWSMASVGPADVDVAELYDGFTHITISWIEALGFCGIGEWGDWVDGGKRIGPGGALPLNTHGGQLTEGRLHGLGFLTEGVLQLRGQCGDRQVEGAEVAVVSNAHGPQCGAVVLTRG
ncbi:MAG: hypothetical protein J2P57_06155 [Acidimicrobiaceae bacterium]|nr:hypothetical protein [Acidimicrobiaceae bacterium]